MAVDLIKKGWKEAVVARLGKTLPALTFAICGVLSRWVSEAGKGGDVTREREGISVGGSESGRELVWEEVRVEGRECGSECGSLC